MFEPSELVSRTLGDYTLREMMGEGTFGAVFRAEETRLEREVAVKVLHAPHLDERDLQRLMHEARLATRLDHPYAAHVYGFGAEPDGLLWIAMELVRGTTLGGMIMEEHAIPLARFAPLFEHICEVVHTAHEQGIVHRDLKPANVMVVNRAGRLLPKLLDFGVARLAQDAQLPDPVAIDRARFSGERSPALVDTTAPVTAKTASRAAVGTPAYMAPELWAGAPADARSDQYALAIMAFHAVAGRRPFVAETMGEMAAAHERQPMPPLGAGFPPALDAVLARAAAKRPEDRYPTVLAFAEAFQAAAAAPAPRRRLRGWAALAAAIVAAAALGWWRLRPAAPAAAHRPSVAVLGLENLGGRDDAAWLGTALGELLAGELVARGDVRRVPAVAGMPAQLDADYTLGGSYLAKEGRLRVDLTLRDTATGEAALAVVEEGSEGQLFDLVNRAGEKLRARLGARDLGPDERALARAALPAGDAAARAYAEGLARLQRLDALGARERLEEATRLDPGFPLAHAALAQAWHRLGHQADEEREARLAWERAAGLPRDQQLVVEAGWRTARKEWPRAIELYRALREFFPGTLDYGLRLAGLQVEAGQARDALETLAQLRREAAAAARDPRVELVESDACEVLADYACQDRAARAAAAKARALDARQLVAEALMAESNAALMIGDRGRAAMAGDLAHQIVLAAGSPASVAIALRFRGRVAWKTGELAAARDFFAQATEIFRRLGDDAELARAASGLAGVESDLGHHPEAMAIYREVLPLYERAANRVGLAQTHINLGQQYLDARQLDDSERELQAALALARELGKRNYEAVANESLGALYLDRGELDRAIAAEEQGQALAAAIKDVTTMAQTGGKLGEALTWRGDVERARATLDQAIAILDGQHEIGRLGWAEINRARLGLMTGRLDAAEAAARRAFELHRRAHVDADDGAAMLARVLVARGKVDEAAEVAAAARGEDLTVAVARAEVELAQRKPAAAAQRLERALAGPLPRVPDRLDAQLVLARAEQASGRAREARDLLRAVETEVRARGFGLLATGGKWRESGR
jgi:eukaryotic-like serine/threonine-protein kinase